MHNLPEVLQHKHEHKHKHKTYQLHIGATHMYSVPK